MLKYKGYSFNAFLIICIVIFIHPTAFSQDTDIKFHYLSVHDGLSRSWVKCIGQDKEGFLWFGTSDGINKYNGYDFSIYKHNAKNTRSLNNNLITLIYEDKAGNFWVGTQEDLNLYDREKDEFIPLNAIKNFVDCVSEYDDGTLLIGSPGGLYLFSPVNLKARQICGNVNIDDILKDRNDNFWIATYNGLWLLDTSDYSYQVFRHIKNNPASISDDFIRSLYEDSRGRIWIGTNSEGLSLMQYPGNNPSSPRFINFRHDPEDPSTIGKGAVLDIIEDKQNRLWIGVENGGLNRIDLHGFDENKCKVTRYMNNPGDNSSISDNSIHCLFLDNQNTLWAGTFGAGLSLFNELLQKFRHYRHIPNNSNTLNNNHINVIYDEDDLLWVGTEGGLNVLNEKENTFRYYVYDYKNDHSLGSDAVWAICRDSRNNMWIGTWGGGLNLFLPSKGSFVRFNYNEKDSATIGGNSVYDIIEDCEGDLWIASMLGGLNKYSATTKKFTRFQTEIGKNSISDNWVRAVVESSCGELWLSSTTAVDIYNKSKGTFTTYKHDPADETSISYNGAIDIFEDSKGHIWLGTNNGLNLFNRHDSSFIHFMTEDGLPNNSVKSICEDDHGNLWLSTNNGISKFIGGVTHPEKRIFKNFDVSDGLQENEFNSRSVFKNKKGEIYFGGINGFNVFHPDSIKDNPYIPKIVFTDFLVFNKSVEIGSGDSLLKKHINETKEITLPHKYSIFSIEFAALNYIAPENNQYKFMLEGFDKDWNTVGTNRMATYTNLDPGRYTFIVKASNSDGLWNEQGASLLIHILPPWWLTWWAKSFYALVILIVLYFFRKYTIISVNFKNKLWIEHIEKQKSEELNQLKFQFFTNISHELRTPLTLIDGPLNTLVKKGTKIHELDIIRENVLNLKTLVDQILDFRKIENNKMQLDLQPVNIPEIILTIVNRFSQHAREKNITLLFEANRREFITKVDGDKIEKIITNILSNAVKNTFEGGTVKIRIDFNPGSELLENAFVIEISDTGRGIAAPILGKIFDRFYSTNGNSNTETGSGIGLNLTKKLVELHGGIITVSSTEGKGSVFSVAIPIPEGQVYNGIDTVVSFSLNTAADALATDENDIGKEPEFLFEKTILIIDDKQEICDYLADILKNEFNVVKETNPLSGMHWITAFMPDLIISDVMMPEMDGFELCKKIKSDMRFSHIPVILLTAKATTEDHIMGFETGADDYIYKPFDEELLKSRIKNLIRQRNTLKEYFIGSDGKVNPSVPVGSLDKIFIEKVFQIIHANYRDPSFTVNDIITEIGMSRSVFYKKLKAISNLSINDLIKNVRMKKATELLIKSSMSISEVAYDTGFGDPAYFSKVFKEHYKVTPKEFTSKNTDAEITD